MSPFPDGTEVDGNIPYIGQFFDKGGTVFNVVHPDFGATGDGATDDGPAWNLAVTNMPANGGTIQVPAGTYELTTAFDFAAKDGIVLWLMPGVVLTGEALPTPTGDNFILDWRSGEINQYGAGTETSTTTNINIAGSTLNKSSIRINEGDAPSTPVNGDIWVTNAGLFVFINGGTVGPLLGGPLSVAAEDITGTTMAINVVAFPGLISTGVITAGEFVTLHVTGQTAIGVALGGTARLRVVLDTDGENIARFEHSGSPEPRGLKIEYTGAAPNSTGCNFLQMRDTGNIRAFFVSNGGLHNPQSNDLDISDERTKSVIGPLDAEAAWSAIGGIEVVRYKDKGQKDARIAIGATAQCIRDCMPESTRRWHDETKLMGVYNKDVVFSLVRLVQDLRDRVVELEN